MVEFGCRVSLYSPYLTNYIYTSVGENSDSRLHTGRDLEIAPAKCQKHIWRCFTEYGHTIIYCL